MAVTPPPVQDIGHPDTGWGLSQGVSGEWYETSSDLLFPQSTITFGRMRHDLEIKAVLSAYKLPLLRANWCLDPEGCRTEVVKHVADDLGMGILGEDRKPGPARRRGVIWQRHLREALNFLTWGFMCHERRYEVMGDGYVRLANLGQRMPWTIAGMDVGIDGVMRSVTQTTQSEPIPASRLVWYVSDQEGGSWAGISPLRAAFGAWLLKHEGWRTHATSIRRFGMGVPQVTAPQGATQAQVQQAQQLASAIRGGDQAGIGLPQGFTTQILGMTGGAPDALAWIEYLDRAIAKSALAGLIELGQTETGSRALGESFLDLFFLSLQAVADEIALTATSGHPGMPGIVTDLVDQNYGEDEPAPRIVCTDVGESHEATADALQALLASGAVTADPELESYVRKSWRLPARQEPPPAPAGPLPVPAVGPGGQPSPVLPPGGQPLAASAARQRENGDDDGVDAAKWDETRHPRVPDGKHGGEFTHGPGSHTGPGKESALDNVWFVENYQDANDWLRFGVKPQWAASDPAEWKQFRQDVKRLAESVTGSEPIHRTVHAYRGLYETEAVFGPVGSKVGQTVKDKGFSSVSTDRDAAEFFTEGGEDPAMAMVQIPAGFRGLPDNREGMSELLLPPGTAYKVMSDKMVSGRRELSLMVVGQPRPPRANASAARRREAEARFDAAAHQQDWRQSLDSLLASYRQVAAAQRADLVDQVTAVAGKPAALKPPPLGEGPDLIAGVMRVTATRAAAAMITEAAGQGVTISPDKVRIDFGKLEQVARARAQVAATAMAQQASVKVLQVQAAAPETEVAVYLDGLTDQNLREQLGAALTAAQNAGRFAVLEAAPESAGQAVYVSTEVLDANTCGPCRDVDGTEFPDLAAAEAAYPTGGYQGCLGLARCRGTAMAIWGDQGIAAAAGEVDVPKAGRRR